ncbi:MAG: hypothetical protein K5907_06560 [Treponema sp.]|nr:hypothetical protein [Treponema sp.]
MKKQSLIDVSVLIIFFNRPGCLIQVWEQVKKARPSRLFLYQDGARQNNEKDTIAVEKCREIVSDIDWDCEVHQNYQDKNYGCDPSGYMSRKWLFSLTDKAIILEDDCVPSQSFFPYCKELLDKYEKDDRINIICGMNNIESIESPYSYIFSETGSIWGWASWKRIFDEGEEDYAFLKDKYHKKLVSEWIRKFDENPNSWFNVWEKDYHSGVVHFEAILAAEQFYNHRLNIVPTKNMITNVGNTPEGSTHSMSDLKLIPHGLRPIYTMKRYEIDFPLKHPKYMVENLEFRKKLNRIMGKGHPLVTFWRKIEKSWLIIKYEGFSALIKKVKKRYLS